MNVNLEEVFSEYGFVRQVEIYKNEESDLLNKFAFVEMGNEREAEAAIFELDGAEWMECTLQVELFRFWEV